METKLSANALAWAKDRGLSASTLERLGVVSGTASMPPDGHKCEVIAFPYKSGAEVVNAKYRTLDGKAFRQREGGEQRFFNLDSVLNGEVEKIYIVEGEPDACALVEAGFDIATVLSVPNGAPAQSVESPDDADRYRYVREALQEGLGRFRQFVLLTDNDAPGQALRQDLVHLLGPARCLYVDWPAGVKDANDALVQWGPEDLRLFVQDGEKEWPVAGLYCLSEIPEPEPLTIWKPGFAEWENKLAFAPTKLSVCTGQPGHGKSTLMTEVWYRIARAYGITVCMASFETQAKPDHRRNIRSFMFGKLEKDLMDAEKAEADAWNDEHFRWLVHPEGRPSLRWILDTAEAAVVRSNARAIVLDPWNGIHHDIPDGMRETDYIGQALDNVMDFARDMRVHFQIIAHPAKSYSPEQRKFRPALEDIAGSKHWDNKPDQGLCVHRPVMFKDGERQTVAELHILKCRFPDLGYPCVLNLDYDLATGCYRSTDYAMRYEPGGATAA